jgi:thymidine kinase
MSGKLTIILGPMFSGKTTELIKNINRARSIGLKVFVVHNHNDTRYGENYICSHLQEKIESHPCQNLNDLLTNQTYQESTILVIEEAQFFDKLYDFVVDQVDNNNKHIILSGLDGDYKRQPFKCNGNMDLLRLIPMSDDIIKLKAYCAKCCDGTPAIFSHLIKTKTETENTNNEIILGGLDKFIALCRRHYLEEYSQAEYNNPA